MNLIDILALTFGELWIAISIYVVEAYLDHASTTPIKKVALDAFIHGSSLIGNPTGSHAAARKAKDVLEQSRENVAEILGGSASEIVFTSGGTEADNLAILGSLAEGKTALCSAIEHHAVLESVEKSGGELIGVMDNGQIDLNHLEDLLASGGDKFGVVSVMLVNNETGVIQPISQALSLVRKYAPSALFHSDAVQAPSYLDVAEYTRGIDLVSISAHKFGGPKGVGALVCRSKVRLKPIIYGGGQEWELRSGTQNLAGIMAMAAALKDADSKRQPNVERVWDLTNLLRATLRERLGVAPNGEDSPQICNISNYCFEGLNSEEILFLLDSSGVYASAGSSCASGALNPSHVLLAMGRSKNQAKGSLRISLGIETAKEEVEYGASVIADVVAHLLSKKGLKRT